MEIEGYRELLRRITYSEFREIMALTLERQKKEAQGTVKTAQRRSSTTAVRTLSFLQILVPKRIADEEIGDALEVIHGLRTNRASRWTTLLIWLKVITTWFWVGLHAVREIGKTSSKKRTD